METNTNKGLTVSLGTASADRLSGTGVNIYASGTTSSLYNMPSFIEAQEVGETIEFIYKESPSFNYTSFPQSFPPCKVFKIVFSCVNGKWNKSERIYGTIIAASSEYYEFD